MHELSLFPGSQAIQVREDLRRHFRQLPSARRSGDLSDARAHGAAVGDAREAGGRQGQFRLVENDPPAAMRYTEARLTHLGAALMQDMDKDTVDFVPNYDERLTEPKVFPAAFPNLLVNGGTGIAVGMATNMAPHNLGEVVDGICAQIDKPDITIPELMKFIKGPDFPTGGFLCGVEGIKNYFTTGKGSLKLRGRIGVEEMKGNREQLVITEIPFNVNRAALEEQIANLVNEKIITEISAMRNESDEHCRLVIELKRDANPKVVIAKLFQHTQLEVSSASTRWRLITAARRRSISRRSSSATSSTAAK
jgi:DNA gyrase subunit A